MSEPPDRAAPPPKDAALQRWTQRAFWPAVLVAAIVLGGRLWGTVRASSPTTDESTHIAGGVSFWAHGVYGPPELEWEHPPLARLLAAYPVVRHLADDGQPVAGLTRSWLFDHASQTLVERARIGPACLTLVLLVSLAWATRRCYGAAAGITVALLAASSPNLIAHGALATTDAAVTVFCFLTVATVAALAERPSLPRAIVAGVCSAAALTSKYTALLMGPIAVGLLLWGLVRRSTRHRLLWLLPVVAVIIYAGVWASFGFDATPVEEIGEPQEPWQVVLPEGQHGRVVSWVREHRLLPDGYLYGLYFARWHATIHGHNAYFFGQVGKHGWTAYFPVAILVKTPLGALALMALGPFAIARRPRLLAVASLGAIAIVLAVAMLSHLNIGLRHVLPAYPFLYLIAGAAAHRLFGAGTAGRVALVALVASAGVSSLRVHPHELTYFNALAGGPRRGHSVLSDSNHDWGQGLKALGDALATTGVGETVWLAACAPGRPSDYGIRWARASAKGALFGAGSPPPEPSGPLWLAASTCALEGGASEGLDFLWYVEPELQPGNSWYLFRLDGKPRHLLPFAAVLRANRRFADARAIDQEALRLRPGSARAAHGLALDALGEGDTEAAHGWLERAVASRPSWGEPRARLAWLALDEGRAAEARTIALAAAAAAPRSSSALIVAGWIEATSGDRDRAYPLLARAEAIAREHGDRHALEQVSNGYLELGAGWHAERARRAAYELLGPFDFHARRAHARFLRKRAQYGEAVMVDAETRR